MEMTKLLAFTYKDCSNLNQATHTSALKMARFLAEYDAGKTRPARAVYDAISSDALGGNEILYFATIGVMETIKSVHNINPFEFMAKVGKMKLEDFTDQELRLFHNAPDEVLQCLPDEIRDKIEELR